MSTLTKYLDKPASVIADAAISVAIAAVVYVAFGLIKGFLPFGDALQTGISGVSGAMVYMRARQNLNDPTPAFKN